MDNDCSSYFKESMNKYAIDLQLAPPNMHYQNSAEREIQTCKSHFVSGFSTTDPYLPISEWGRLIFQYLITLNILHNSRSNQALSA